MCAIHGYRPPMLTLLLLACDSDLELNSSHTKRADRPDHTEAAADDSDGDTAGRPDDTGDDDTGAGADATLPQWTVLVFINGDNDLEQSALDDMNEMEAVGSTDEVQVVVQIDRSEDYTRADGDWTEARRYLVQADSDERRITSPVLESLGEVDSGSADAVLDFVAWGAANFPAQRYLLVFWDHGDGWSFQPQTGADTKAISEDYDSGNHLSVAGGDVTEVVEGAAAIFGQPIDLLGFDACNMQQWEVANSVIGAARYVVASQDYEDVTGWPYDAWLTDLVAEPDMDPARLGDTIALRFHETPDSTQSVLDLGELPALNTALDTLADALVASGSAGQVLRAAADGAQGYDGRFSTEHDLTDLLTRMEAASEDVAVKAAAVAAKTRVEALVLANYNEGGAVKNSYGLTIYSPAEGGAPPIYRRSSWAAASKWDEFLMAAGEAE